MKLSRKSFYWFFHLYFGHYIHYETAEFQKDIMNYVSDPEREHVVIVAFRGSGKSTIVSTALPLWAMIGSMQKKYIVIVSQTQQQAQQHLRNLRAEIESNDLFRNDFGNLEEESNEWGISALTLPKVGAKIIALSRDQGVRGLRSGPYRPDLIISDDVEDTASVKTQEGRNKTYDWFTSEIIPLGSQSTKFVTIGNLLHEDSLLMRLRDGFRSGSHSGEYFEYPIERDKVSLWPGAFPDDTALDRHRKRIGNRIAWEREFMLRIVPDEDQIITRTMIQTYNVLPARLHGEYQSYEIGVDLAISEKDTADYSAIVTILVRGRGRKRRLYVLPHPVNRRMSFPKTIDTLLDIDDKLGHPRFFVESTAYQKAAVQSLKTHGVNVNGIEPRADKRSRLNMIADPIERGVLLFPEQGCELLIRQLIGFGVEKHDDLMDALTTVVNEIVTNDSANGTVSFGHHPIWDAYGPHGYKRTGGKRSSWSTRLDDFEEATRNQHLYD